MRQAAKANQENDHTGKAGKSEETSGKFQRLFEDELKGIYWAEKALVKAIPKMIKNATSQELAQALEKHLEETEGHVERLEKVFGIIGKTAQAKKCEAMDGLINKAEETMEDCDEGVMRDAGIITAGQKVEHYEIATYGSLHKFAETLGFDEAADLLSKTLEEEKAADEKLTEVGESVITIEAANEDQD